MKTIFWRTIKDRRLILIIFIVICILFLWLYISLFPVLQSQAEQLQKLLETYPASFGDAFGFKNSALFFSNLENYLSTEMFTFMWPILLISLLVSAGGYSIAGEIEKGTIETLLAQPLSRLKLFFAKYLAGFSLLVIFTTLSIVFVFPLALAYRIDFSFVNYIYLWIGGNLFGLAILSLASMFSAIFSEKGKVYFVSVGLLVLMYALNIIASLKDSLDSLKYISFFHYFDPNVLLGEKKLDWLTLVVFLGFSLACIIIAILVFRKRDVSVA